MNYVGTLDWYCCKDCVEYREIGGCNPLDDGGDILEIDFEAEAVICTKWRKKEGKGSLYPPGCKILVSGTMGHDGAYGVLSSEKQEGK